MADGNVDQNQNQNQTQQNQNTGYSQEYISSLRDEAASWRTKLRESEAKIEVMHEDSFNTTIASELKTRGLTNIDPKWIATQDGDNISKAVDNFLEKNPNFKVDKDDRQNQEHKETKKPMNTNKDNTNNKGFDPNPDITAIRKDPVARSKMRDQYRALLSKNKQT